MLALALDPALILAARGITPDPWQRALLLSADRQILLNCSRQSGKSTVVSALALHTALFTAGSLMLLLSPSQRQSAEIFRKVLDAYKALGRPLPARQQTQLRLELANGSRVLCLPGREGTIRSFGGVNLLVLDEAARIPDDLYRSVRPMLAVSQGRLVALSTPFGQRGWFWQEWEGTGPWQRVRITWRDCPRITPAFIAEETRAMGLSWVRQEYAPTDFGRRNPFAAVWGVLDRDDVLWIAGERYRRETPLHEHAAALRERGEVTWYADPAGRTEIEELRAGGLVPGHSRPRRRGGLRPVVQQAIEGGLRTRMLERAVDSGPWPCDVTGAATLRLTLPGKPPPPPQLPGVRVADADLDIGQFQDLADQLGEVKKASAGFELKLHVRIELSGGKPVPPEVVDKVNKVLERVSDAIRLQ
jgi:hypothetical protein